MNPGTVWISCGVLRAELEELHLRGLIDGDLVFFDSMLHMDPPRLEAILLDTLERKTSRTGPLVLVYGDCSSGMLDLVSGFRVGRVNAINCAQLLVGRERYRQLMREEAFLVLPEWARRWQHIMSNELGLTSAVAQDLMGENRRELVFLDTGLTPVPERELIEFSAYCGLPWRVERVLLDFLLAALLEAQAGAENSSAGNQST